MKSLHQFFRAVHDPKGVEVPGTLRLCAGLLLWVPVVRRGHMPRILGEMFPNRDSGVSGAPTPRGTPQIFTHPTQISVL